MTTRIMNKLAECDKNHKLQCLSLIQIKQAWFRPLQVVASSKAGPGGRDVLNGFLQDCAPVDMCPERWEQD